MMMMMMTTINIYSLSHVLCIVPCSGLGVLHVLTYLALMLALVKWVIFVPILQKEKQTQKVEWLAKHCTTSV